MKRRTIAADLYLRRSVDDDLNNASSYAFRSSAPNCRASLNILRR
jgi:hypothetical protein